MNSETQLRERDVQFRSILVGIAAAGSIIRPRRTRTVVGAAAAAFVLGCVLTGGAFATAATINAQQAKTENLVAQAGHDWAAKQDAELIGKPFVYTTSGTIRIKLGTPPAGATALVEALDCLGPGTFVDTIDGGSKGSTSCSTADLYQPGVGDDNVSGGGPHIYTVTSSSASKYVIWLSWIKMPSLAPSAAQRAALADGLVTRDEYVAAFNQYVGCMAAAGYPVSNISESASNIEYQASPAAVQAGADNRCYLTQFKSVAGLWDTEDGGAHNVGP